MGPKFDVGDGGFRKSALIDGWVFVPPTENLGDPMAGPAIS